MASSRVLVAIALVSPPVGVLAAFFVITGSPTFAVLVLVLYLAALWMFLGDRRPS